MARRGRSEDATAPQHGPRLGGVRCLSSVLLLGLCVVGAGGQGTGDDDPLPLLRIALTPEQLTQELGRLKQGTLVKLPRAEFESRVRKAAAAQRAPKLEARVVRAHYAAELADHDLVQGRGEWTIAGAGTDGVILPLASLSFALSHSAWEDGGKAILGDLDGQGLGLWVASAGTKALFFDWTCRGTRTPQGLSFELRLPPAPQSTLELRLPADSWPSLPPNTGLLTGPHDAGVPGKRLWKLQVTGKTQVELAIRKVPAGDVPLFVETLARQYLLPDRVTADFDYQLEVPHGAVRELVFEGDSSLEPFEVTARSAELSWRWDAPGRGTPGGPPGTLTVEFREPQHGALGSLRVRCRAPRPMAPAEWVSPALRLRQAIGRSSTLVLTVHPDVQLERWHTGDFQLSDAATDTEGGQTLTLVDLRAAVNGPSTRPRCQLVTGGAECSTLTQTRWHAEPTASTLTSEIAYRVLRGRLYQLALKLPGTGGPWRVEAVDVEPKGSLQNWAVAGPLLLVDLQHGATPRAEVRLRVKLTATLKPTAGPRTLDLPDVEPLGALLRTGRYAVTLDPRLQAQLLQASAAAIPQADANERAAPAFSFVYHTPLLTGKLRLFTERPRLSVTTRTEVTLGTDTGDWRAKVEIEPLLGRPAKLDLFLAPPLQPGWQARAPDIVRQTERLVFLEALPYLAGLGARSGLDHAALRLALPSGECWRIHFTAPFAEKTTLDLHGRFSAVQRAEGQTVWQVPLLSLPAAEQHESSVVVHEGQQQVRRGWTQGLEPARLPSGAPLEWRARERAVPALHLVTTPGPTAVDQDAVCESRELTSCLDEDGTLVHRLRVRLRHWREPSFAVLIPDEAAQALAARVDGGWLERVDTQPARGETRFTLQVNRAAAVQDVELIYTAGRVTGTLLCQALAPTPVLPKAPLVATWVWRLPPGWAPWDARRWQPCGLPSGVRAEQALAAAPARLWHAADGLMPAWNIASASWSEAQRAELLRAENGLHAELVAGSTLGAALSSLTRQLEATASVVIDRVGLGAAQRWPTTPLPADPADRPFWDRLELVFVPCPAGLVLTTPQRVREWQLPLRSTQPLGEVLDAAVAAAALYGEDQAGCFCSTAQWLRTAHEPGAPASSRSSALTLLAELPASGWTDWEPVPGVPVHDEIALLQVPAMRWLGYLSAGLWLAVAVWLGRRQSARTTFRVQLLVSALLLVAACWLPAAARTLLIAPLLLTELAAFALTLTIRGWPLVRRSAPSQAPPPKASNVRVIASVLLAAVGAAVPLTAQPAPEPQPVYLFTGTNGAPFVLVAPTLLRKLDQLAAPQVAPPTGAVVIAARYQGRLQDGAAEVAARFELQHFSEQSTFVLPLTGVQLQPGVFLDGAPVFPVASKGGLAVPLRGKGLHQLTLSFRARVSQLSDHAEVRFGIPRAGQAELELHTTAPVPGLTLVGGLGAAKIQLDKQTSTVHAQLGHEAAIQLRWPGTAPAVPAAVEVREAYFWDLRPASLALKAAVQFTVTRGSVAQLRLALPPTLEVRQVAVAAPPSSPGLLPGSLAAPALRQWQVVGKDAGRQLVVDLTQAVTGSVALTLDCTPRLALTAGTWQLRLPAPLGANSVAGLLAYRVDGSVLGTSPQNVSLGTVVTPERLNESWVKLALPDPARATKVLNFRRSAPTAALGLSVQPTRPTATIEARWQIGANAAEVSAELRVASAADDLVLLELELPPRFNLGKLADGGGTSIHHWSRHDRLVQVWLQQPRKQARLALQGWVEHTKTGATVRCELAAFRVVQARATASTLTLQVQPGLALVPERLVHLSAPGPGGTHTERTDANNYEAVFRVLSERLAAHGRAFTLVERRGEFVELTTALHFRPQPGEMQLTVAGWTGGELTLETPAPLVRKGQRQQGGLRVWTLQLPAGLPEAITLTLRGRLPVSASAGCTLPALQVSPQPLEEHWVGLSGVELEPGVRVALQAGTLPLACPRPPRTLPAATRVGQLPAPNLALKVRTPPTTAATDPVQILCAHQDCSWSGTGWLHRLQVVVFARGRGELRLRLPAGALCRAVANGGQVTAPTEPELALALPGEAGPRTVQVYWTYEQGEAPTQPGLAAPYLAGAPALHSRLWLPAAYELSARSSDDAPSAAQAVLREAAARLDSCRLWTEHAPNRAVLHREQQSLHADLAEAASLVAAEQRLLPSAASSALTTRLQQLRLQAQALAKQTGWPTNDSRWQPAPTATLLAEQPPRGLPVWLAPTTTVPLVSAMDAEEALARRATEVILLLVLVLLLLSYVRGSLAVLLVAWPETLLATTALGIFLGGLTPLAVGLCAFGLSLRLLWLCLWLERVWPTWFSSAAAPPTPSAGSAPPS